LGRRRVGSRGVIRNGEGGVERGRGTKEKLPQQRKRRKPKKKKQRMKTKRR